MSSLNPSLSTLESSREEVGSAQLRNILRCCLTDDVLGPHVKKRRREEVKAVRSLFNANWRFP